MHVGCSMERGRHGGKAEGRRVGNRPCDVAHRSEVCGSRTLLGPCVASSSLGMLYGSRGALGPSWGRAWQHREVPSPVRAYPCLCRSEPQVRNASFKTPHARFKTKLRDQHDASSPNHEGLYMYYRMDGGVAVSTRCSLQNTTPSLFNTTLRFFFIWAVRHRIQIHRLPGSRVANDGS